VRDKFPLRQATQTLARERLAAALDAIDCKKSGSRRLAPSTLFRTRRSWTVGAKVPLRP
jgi:hypothetical protein